MNTNNTKQTDRDKAKVYFDNLSRSEVKALVNKHYPNTLQVTGSMYLEIWRKETQPTTTDEGGELQCTEGEWYKSGNIILVKDKQVRVGLFYTHNSWDQVSNKPIHDVEQEANIDLCVASKGLYYQLDRLVDFINTYGIRDEAGNSLLEDIDLDSAIETLQKANKNYKP